MLCYTYAETQYSVIAASVEFIVNLFQDETKRSPLFSVIYNVGLCRTA